MHSKFGIWFSKKGMSPGPASRARYLQLSLPVRPVETGTLFLAYFETGTLFLALLRNRYFVRDYFETGALCVPTSIYLETGIPFLA